MNKTYVAVDKSIVNPLISTDDVLVNNVTLFEPSNSAFSTFCEAADPDIHTRILK
jgi:hypothetical protein